MQQNDTVILEIKILIFVYSYKYLLSKDSEIVTANFLIIKRNIFFCISQLIF